MDKETALRFDTICVKENMEIGKGSPHVLPLHATSAFSYNKIEDSIDVFKGQEDGYVYSRYGNPTVTSVQDKLAQLECLDIDENGFCVMTSSGLSAISTLSMSLLQPGDALLTQANLYGGTTEIFSKILGKYGIDVIFIDLNERHLVEEKLGSHPNIKMLYFESPSNPTLSCIDIKAITNLAHEHNALAVIDNTFSTCYIQRPFTMGVDFVIYSTTKFLNGHGNGIAGAIIGKDNAHRKAVWTNMKLLGTNCNPFDAWLVHNGLKTLTVRMDKHCTNAQKIAEHLEKHPKVDRVNYPGLPSFEHHDIAKKQMTKYGGMLSFELKGNIEDAKRFMNNTELCSITSTLGNVDTLLLHPATASHLNIPKDIRLENGITDGLIRVSVGIENVEDLIADIEKGIG